MIRDYTTSDAVTIRPESDLLAAVAILKAGRFRCLPVVTADGQLVGIVTDKDLAAASPPSVADLQPRKPDYFGVHLRAEQVMNPEPITIGPEVPLEEAALVMLQRRADRLLIMEHGQLVGIITSTDIFRQYVAILGGGSSALRLTVEVDNLAGQLARLAGDIASLGGNIISVATTKITKQRMTLPLRLEGVDWHELWAALERREGFLILHVCGDTEPCSIAAG